MCRVFCGNCGCLLVPEESAAARTPCPDCSSTSRLFDERGHEQRVRWFDYAMATTLRDEQPIGFTESERPDITRSATLEPDGTVVLDLRGQAPQNEQDSRIVCETLLRALDAKGADLTLLGPGKADEDWVILDRGKRVGIQVVRAIVDTSFWARLARSGDVSHVCLTVGDAAESLQSAIQYKATTIPPRQRPSLILALDAFRLPALALGPVVAEFRTKLSAWTRSLGFRAVYVVGPDCAFVARLDE